MKGGRQTSLTASPHLPGREINVAVGRYPDCMLYQLQLLEQMSHFGPNISGSVKETVNSRAAAERERV